MYLTTDEAKILLHDRTRVMDKSLATINYHIKKLKAQEEGILLDNGTVLYYKQEGFYLSGFDTDIEEIYNYLELSEDYLLSLSDNLLVA